MLRCYQPESLFDLIGKDELRLLLGGVCADVELPAMVVNKDGETAQRSGASRVRHPCEFCREFRRHPQAKAACNDSERQAGADVMADGGQEALVGSCHMQLLWIGVLIRVEGMTLGAALTGPLRKAELDADFEKSIASWIPKLGEARVGELRAFYRKLPTADEETIANRRDRLLQGVRSIEAIASGVFKRDRNAAEKAFLAELGFSLSRAAREHEALDAAAETLGRGLGDFLDSTEYSVALYEGQGGRRLAHVCRAPQRPTPAKFVPLSVVHHAPGEMRCVDSHPNWVRQLFSRPVPGLGVVTSRFDHKEQPFAVMFASRAAADKLKAVPKLISGDFWNDVATTFRTAFSEIEYGAELRSKVEEVQRSEQALRAYIEKAVHDLKMPLSAMMLRAEDAMQRSTSARVKDRVQQIVEFGDELTTKIQTLVRGATEQVGERRQRVAPQKIAVKKMVLNVVRRYGHRIRKRKHREVIDFRAKADPVVYGDPLELETVFYNLVDNAVKYTYPGKDVRAVLDADEVELHFEIENYGLGILPDEKDKVWERYYRGKHDDDWSGAVSGSGIGLFVVRQIIDDYGGRVWFYSRPSTGTHHDPTMRAGGNAYLTKFFLTLPLRGSEA